MILGDNNKCQEEGTYFASHQVMDLEGKEISKKSFGIIIMNATH